MRTRQQNAKTDLHDSTAFLNNLTVRQATSTKLIFISSGMIS